MHLNLIDLCIKKLLLIHGFNSHRMFMCSHVLQNLLIIYYFLLFITEVSNSKYINLIMDLNKCKHHFGLSYVQETKNTKQTIPLSKSLHFPILIRKPITKTPSIIKVRKDQLKITLCVVRFDCFLCFFFYFFIRSCYPLGGVMITASNPKNCNYEKLIVLITFCSSFY